MSRSEPTEGTDFPVYRVQAKCRCGREGWTKSFRKDPEGTVISATCYGCVEKRKARVVEFENARFAHKTPKPEPKPLEHKPHWTDKLP